MTHQKKPHAPRLLSLCSGIGGIDLAWEMAGGEIAGQCELDDYCQRVLARHWPDVKRVADIRSVWGDSFDGPIDLVAGGIPCQPWSVAGKRRGHADDRHLWPEMRRIIEIYQPAWVLIENVAGFARLALDGVLADLGADGYEASAVMVPAAATGAPHLRERIFVVGRLVAHTHDQRQSRPFLQHRDAATRAIAEWSTIGQLVDASSQDISVANAHRQRWPQGDAAKRDAARQSDCRAAEGADMADAAGGSRCGATQRNGGLALAGDTAATGDGQAISCGARLERRGPGWTVGQSGQAQPRMGRDTDGFSRRLDGAGLIPPRHSWPAGPGQAQHSWEVPRVTQERIPDRAARLKALGNAVVPNQVYPVLAAIIAVWRQEMEAAHV